MEAPWSAEPRFGQEHMTGPNFAQSTVDAGLGAFAADPMSAKSREVADQAKYVYEAESENVAMEDEIDQNSRQWHEARPRASTSSSSAVLAGLYEENRAKTWTQTISQWSATPDMSPTPQMSAMALDGPLGRARSDLPCGSAIRSLTREEVLEVPKRCQDRQNLATAQTRSHSIVAKVIHPLQYGACDTDTALDG